MVRNVPSMTTRRSCICHCIGTNKEHIILAVPLAAWSPAVKVQAEDSTAVKFSDTAVI